MSYKTNTYNLYNILFFCLSLLLFLPSAIGQNSNIITTRIDSNCTLHINLLDSLGYISNANAPYLLQVNQYQENSNAAATWELDLNGVQDSILHITIINNNQLYYTDTIYTDCTTPVPPPFTELNISSLTPATTCTSNDGAVTVSVANTNTPQYSFIWVDGSVTQNVSSITKTNLRAGVYTVIVTDTLGQSNAIGFEIPCPSSSNITCHPSKTLYLNQNGKASLGIQDVIDSATALSEEYFIDVDGHTTLYHNFDCSTIGYQYLTLLSQDTVNNIYDTCQVLVQIIDTFNYCSGTPSSLQIVDSIDIFSCNTCNSEYIFDYLINPISGDTLYEQNLIFYWADTLLNTSFRNDLCPNTLYELTAIDAFNNVFQYNITVDCNNNCIVTPTFNSSCPDSYVPVCGCNGITYKNACVATYQAGVQIWSRGACPTNDFQVNITTVADSNACNSLTTGTGSIFANVTGGSGVFTYQWSTGQNTATIHNLNSGSYRLVVTDVNNNLSKTTTVFVGTQGCVWPGDTDDNGIVNNFDLLQIGLAYGNIGSPRTLTSINWQSFAAPSWLAGPAYLDDQKHIDCNGDGRIDSLDIEAIQQNYMQAHGRNPNNSLIGTIPFYIKNAHGSVGDSITTEIILGDNNSLATDVYGLAFTMHYNPEHLTPALFPINFNNSWLGNDLIYIQKNNPQTGQVDVAVSRKNQRPISGSGAIGRVTFTIKDDLVMGRTQMDSIISPIGISNIRLINAQNQPIGIYPKAGGMVLKKQRLSVQQPTTTGLRIYPNPAQDVLHIQSESANLKRVQIFTATGRLIKNIYVNNTQTQTINTKNFAKGIYFIHVHTSQGSLSEKIHVNN